ncbi:hypothetical protein ABW20_dc0100907 [Dactylellina cionopaga]|nr:hypothetical protein ABW20_dc0100907 [Dactylellina cionopaga]
MAASPQNTASTACPAPSMHTVVVVIVTTNAAVLILIDADTNANTRYAGVTSRYHNGINNGISLVQPNVVVAVNSLSAVQPSLN